MMVRMLIYTLASLAVGAGPAIAQSANGPQRPLDQFTKALDSPSASERQKAISMLGAMHDMGQFVGTAVPSLVRRLKDETPSIRLSAASLLVSIQGQDAKEAIAYLTEIANDGKAPGAIAARGILKSVENGTAKKSRVHDLMSQLNNQKSKAAPDLAALGLAGLARLDARNIPPDSVATLLDMLKKGETIEVRLTAAQVLAALKSEDAVAPLSEILRSGDERTRIRAATYLGEIGPGAKAAVPALLEVLTTYTRLGTYKYSSAEYAAEALGKIGAAAVPGVASLLSRERNPEVRVVAARILFRFGREAKEAKPALDRALKDPNAEVCSTAAAALVEIEGKDAKAAFHLLALALRHHFNPDGVNGPAPDGIATNQIRQMTTDAKVATMPVLLDAINSKDNRARAMCANLLHDIACPEFKPFLPRLFPLAMDPRSGVAGVMASAVKKIDPELALKNGIR